MEYSKMNGFHDNVEITDRKPIVTYSGEKDLFHNLESTLVNSLPQEPADWSRSYGRATKSVNVSATFVPFSVSLLPKEGDIRLIDQPVFHTYWTQCSDVDVYKTTVRDEIDQWMKTLMQHNISDWMIVLVETYDFRKPNKLIPRTTVLDKIRSDFGAKHADRCLSVINPLKSESRSAGSWRGLVVNMRLLLLSAFDKSLSKFEEFIRIQRERRNQPNWTFTTYFLLQEELAFVLEMLGVYEEALVQYDELDALFTQFILNSNLGECPGWLGQFKKPLDSWAGLSLAPGLCLKDRAKISNNNISLIQFRNYLFSRQCAMLLAANKPAEVAERTLGFLHNCIRELTLLEVTCPKGAVASWVFLSCLEVLQICQTYTDPEYVQKYSIHTAGLWAYARLKLGELGVLCGLMPPCTQPQLHMVVEISIGLGEHNTQSIEKLKQALSSKEAFSKQYLELSELAISTYKHIGRVRCARSLGHDLAEFYMNQCDFSMAASFLQDSLRIFERDGWSSLANQTRLKLALCYKKLNDIPRYVKICAAVSSSDLDMATRMNHFNEMVTVLNNSKSDVCWTGCLNDCVTLKDIDLQVEKGSSDVSASLSLFSHLPAPVSCSNIAVAIVLSKHENKSYPKNKEELCRKKSKEDLGSVNPLLQKLPITSRLDYQQDRSLGVANVDIRNQKQLLRRQDSHGKYRKNTSVTKSDFTKALSASNISLQPGLNTISLSAKDLEPGYYRLGQFSFCLLSKLELLSVQVPHKLYFEIIKTIPVVSLVGKGGLIAGINQTVSVLVSSEGCTIPKGSKICIKTTKGLAIQLVTDLKDKDLVESLDVTLPEVKDSMQIDVSLLAQLPVQAGPIIKHQLIVGVDWSIEETILDVEMVAALTSDLRVYTCLGFKYLHVTMTCGSASLRLHSANLSCYQASQAILTPANPPLSTLVLNSDSKVSYMWKLSTGENLKSKVIKIELSLNYELLCDEAPQTHLYKCIFDLVNYETLFNLEGRIEPCRGSEFCRVSTVCQLIIKVTRVSKSEDSHIMYEVSAETNRWAVCGRNTGVLSLEDNNEGIVVIDVMPLVNGFLPLPTIKLSRYILAKQTMSSPNSRVDSARLEQFFPGQIHYLSKGYQAHVIAGVSP